MNAAVVGVGHFANSLMFVRDTGIIGCYQGIITQSTTASLELVVEHCHVQGSASNTFAIYSGPFSRTVIRDSVIANARIGVFASTDNTSMPADVTVENSLLASNATGAWTYVTVQSQPPAALIRVSNSTITMNGTGVIGDVIGRGNNTLEANDTNGTFSGTFGSQ